MLSFRVFAKFHPRRPLVARRFTLPVNVLTDRCPRTIEAPVMERISRQPRASRGVGLVLLQALSLPRCVLTSLRCFIFSKSFICNIYAPLRKRVANKRLTRSLNPLDATFTRNRGWGVRKRRFPTRLGPSTENLLGIRFSVQRRDRVAFLPPPMQIVHRDVQINVPARRFNANHQRFRIRAACQTRFVHVNFRRKHFEVKSLVIKQRHRISDDHVRQFANRLFHYLLARFKLRTCELARHFHRHFRRQVENHAPFNVASDRDQRRDTLAAIRVFVHFQVHDFRRPLQRLRENRVRGVDERLDQFHSHERCSPAKATGAPTALGSSLSTYRRISYSTSGFTGFCTKCFAPFWSAARIFSWYPTDETMTMRALACCRTMRSTASIPSICGMVMSMSTMSGLIRLNSAIAVRPSLASPATSPPNISIILMRFLRAKTESSTTR